MKSSISILFLSTLVNVASFAQLVEVRIAPTDPHANSEFGRSLGISGDYVIVGAGRDNTLGEGAGAAYIFKKAGRDWLQQAKLLASDGGELDRMGKSVAIANEHALVGAFNDRSDIGPGAGSAYVFERGGASWVQKAKLRATDGAPYDQFGFSVSISGGYAIVGAFLDDNVSIDAGAAYIFRKEGTEWLEEVKLVAADADLGDGFGVSVAIDGGHAVVGASNDDDKGINAGAAYVFNKDGAQWTQVAKLTAGDGSVLDYFGESVAISGKYVLVGARYRDDAGLNAGGAYVFRQTESGWIEDGKILPLDGDTNDQFGECVALSGDHAVISAFFDSDTGEKSGSVYVFHRKDRTWVQQKKITASDGQSGDWFGLAAAIDSQHTVVGKWADVDGGAAYVYSGYLSPISVALDIEPRYDPVPAVGDTFPANLAVTNVTQDTALVDLWLSLDLPTGGQRHVFGPKTLQLNPSQTIDKHAIVRVPGQGPSGTYTLTAYWGGPGTYPGDTLGTEVLTFSKLTEETFSLTGTTPAMTSNELQKFGLHQNFPNPFNPSTSIGFEMRSPGHVSLKIYDLLGREVVTLVDEFRNAGSHVVWWDGKNASRELVSSGAYIYRLVSGNDVTSRRLLLGK